MPEYLITWTIEIEADSPLEAVQEARKIQLDPESISTIFSAEDDEGSDPWTIDLNDPETYPEEEND